MVNEDPPGIRRKKICDANVCKNCAFKPTLSQKKREELNVKIN